EGLSKKLEGLTVHSVPKITEDQLEHNLGRKNHECEAPPIDRIKEMLGALIAHVVHDRQYDANCKRDYHRPEMLVKKGSKLHTCVPGWGEMESKLARLAL